MAAHLTMKVIVENLAIEYSDQGQGPVMLMLHGWAAARHYFDGVYENLSGLRIVRLDLPGFGDSEKPRAAWTNEDYARFVAAFCEKLRIKPDYMLGHSLGGRILTKGVSIGVLHPKKLVLISSAGVAKRNTPRNRLYAALAKTGKTLLKPLPKKVYEKLRHVLYDFTGSDYLSVRDMEKTFVKVVGEDLSADAAKITTPTLLIWGDRDAVTPLAEGEKLNALIRGSQLEIVEGADHFVHLQEPEDVARRIEKFLI